MSAGLRPARGRIELQVGLGLVVAFVGVGIALAVRRTTPVEPGLVVAPAAFDFGTVWEQPAFRHTFAVTNPSDAPVRVTEIKTGCGCTKVEPQSFVVRPGERQELTATLNFTGQAGEWESKPFAVEMLPNIAHQPPGKRTVWTLHGDVRPNPIVVSEPSIDFGDETIRGESAPVRDLEVSLAEQAPFEDVEVSIVEGAGWVDAVSLGPRQWQFAVSPPHDLPLGPFAVTVRIEAVAEGTTPGPFREVKVAGKVRDDIAAWPATVNFGALDVGETAREYVVIASHRGKPFEVASIETSEGVVVKPAPDQLGDGSRTVVVTVVATQRGDHQDAITFHLRRTDPPPGGLPDLTISLNVRYYGTPEGP